MRFPLASVTDLSCGDARCMAGPHHAGAEPAQMALWSASSRDGP